MAGKPGGKRKPERKPNPNELALRKKVSAAVGTVIGCWNQSHNPAGFLDNLRKMFPLVSEVTWKQIENGPEIAILRTIHGKSMPIELKEALSSRCASEIGKHIFREELAREN